MTDKPIQAPNLKEGLDDLVKYVNGEPSHAITDLGDGNLIISEMHYDSLISENKLLRKALEDVPNIKEIIRQEITLNCEDEFYREKCIRRCLMAFGEQEEALKAIEKKEGD